jgi:two-component system, NtrC family, C4-dicarboxylate transport sensor histidine kinase DctB
MRRRLQVLLGGLLLLAAISGIAAAGHTLAFRSGVERLQDPARRRLDMITSGLQNELGRFDFLPALLEATPEVYRLLDKPEDGALREQVNRRLSGINAMAGSANLMVLDHRGVVVAASEGELPGVAPGTSQGMAPGVAPSVLPGMASGIAPGTDLSSRPHVKDALAQGRGRHYGVVAADPRAAYHLSYALYQAERQRGVAAVKVDLLGAEQGWRLLPGNVMLVDEDGVVILATRDGWRYRALAPLAAGAQAQGEQQRPTGRPRPSC